MTLTEEEIDEFVTGKCVDLASAIHRLTGWEIQAVIEPAEGGYAPWVGHAWCIDPATGNCVDIDGSYPMARNGWLRSDNEHVVGMNEAQLREVTTIGAGINWDPNSWDSGVEAALPIARDYVLSRLTAA
jgi:hypothetical protein